MFGNIRESDGFMILYHLAGISIFSASTNIAYGYYKKGKGFFSLSSVILGVGVLLFEVVSLIILVIGMIL